MKPLARILSTAILALIPFSASAQITVKPTPAADALNHAASDFQKENKSLEDLVHQAQFGGGQNAQTLQKEMMDLSNKLHVELLADKKYKGEVEAIDKVQTQLKDLQKTTQEKFNQESAPIQQAMATDNALIDGLIPIVRKENGFSDGAEYDRATQTWKVKDQKK
jgi:predicted RNase H-like nuclease (RuvC/YqgF family)